MSAAKVSSATTRERPLYSQRFLERYGRSLTRAEIRLIQGYRVLSRGRRDAVAAVVSTLVLMPLTGAVLQQTEYLDPVDSDGRMSHEGD